MAMLSRVRVLGALAMLTILILPPSLLVVPSASAHTASQIICRHKFIPSPNVGSGDNALDGVVTITSSDAWAVGEQFNNSTIDQTLTEHWTLSGWQVLTNPPIGTNFSALRAVSAPKTQTPLAFAWAVGGFVNNGASSQTLTELIACTGGR